jgi:uncharacterized membrane protein
MTAFTGWHLLVLLLVVVVLLAIVIAAVVLAIAVGSRRARAGRDERIARRAAQLLREERRPGA